jgi:hypothetical protein
MRNYWLKIALGALGVFLVGFLGVSLFRKARTTVVSTFDSTDPISLPIPFVDFKLEGQKLGEVSRVVLLREQPDRIASVTVVLDVVDSLRTGLHKCIVSVDNLDHFNDKTSFQCHTPEDTAGLTLIPFGRVAFKGGSTDTIPLLLPAQAVSDIQRISFRHHGNSFQINQVSDSEQDVRDSIQELRDSIREAIGDSLSAAADQRSDSLHAATEHLADSLAEAALKRHATAPKKPVAPSAAPKTAKPAKPTTVAPAH